MPDNFINPVISKGQKHFSAIAQNEHTTERQQSSSHHCSNVISSHTRHTQDCLVNVSKTCVKTHHVISKSSKQTYYKGDRYHCAAIGLILCECSSSDLCDLLQHQIVLSIQGNIPCSALLNSIFDIKTLLL